MVIGALGKSGYTGAAYVFTRDGETWTQQADLKASNSSAKKSFGSSVAVSGDTLAVGAYFEESSTKGVDSIADDKAKASGAAYIFNLSAASK
jgi:hypothetical protein